MSTEFNGMTVNEGYTFSGIMDDFDKAIEQKNIDLVQLILKKVEITDESLIVPILKQLGLSKFWLEIFD